MILDIIQADHKEICLVQKHIMLIPYQIQWIWLRALEEQQSYYQMVLNCVSMILYIIQAEHKEICLDQRHITLLMSYWDYE